MKFGVNQAVSLAMAELARCEAEQRDMLAQPECVPAWLVTLGIEDWEAEKFMILMEAIG